MKNTATVRSVAAEPNASSASRVASTEKYESPYKPLQHRRQYVDYRRQKNILLGDVERDERHSLRRLRSGHTRVTEGILFGTYNRVYRQRAEGNYRESGTGWEQAARRYPPSFYFSNILDWILEFFITSSWLFKHWIY